MRTTIKQTPDNTVVLTEECPFSGDILETEFTVPTSGGYVRDQDGNQVCEMSLEIFHLQEENKKLRTNPHTFTSK